MAALTTGSSAQYTNYALGTIDKFVNNLWGNPVYMAHATYATTGSDTVAQDATIGMCVVPKGARLIGFIINYDAAGSAATVKMQAGTTDCSATSSSMAAAGGQFLGVLAAYQSTALTADTVINMYTVANTIAATKTVNLTVLYVRD